MAERKKVCAKCGVEKPWSDFYPKKKWEDGTTRTVGAYCKPCKREYERSPDYRATKKKYADRNRVSRAADDRIRRSAKRRARGIPQRGPYKQMNGRPIIGSRETDSLKFRRLDSEPFLAWWDELPAEDKSIIHKDELMSRAILRIRKLKSRVDVDTVDRAGILLGQPDLLRRLYG